MYRRLSKFIAGSSCLCHMMPLYMTCYDIINYPISAYVFADRTTIYETRLPTGVAVEHDVHIEADDRQSLCSIPNHHSNTIIGAQLRSPDAYLQTHTQQRHAGGRGPAIAAGHRHHWRAADNAAARLLHLCVPKVVLH